MEMNNIYTRNFMNIFMNYIKTSRQILTTLKMIYFAKVYA